MPPPKPRPVHQPAGNDSPPATLACRQNRRDLHGSSAHPATAQPARSMSI